MRLPHLESPRLKLRAFQESDIESLYRLWIDPLVRKYLWDDQVIPCELAAETVRMSLRSSEAEGLGMWTLARQDTGTLTGFCGFRRIGASSEVELLYGLSPEFWGQGLATEAAQVAVDWLFATHDLDRLVASADESNAASLRVLHRLRMTPLEGGVAIVPGVQYYQLRRIAWLAQSPMASESQPPFL